MYNIQLNASIRYDYKNLVLGKLKITNKKALCCTYFAFIKINRPAVRQTEII